jgi:predicted secreted protein
MRILTALIITSALAGCAGSGSSPSTSDSSHLLGTYTGILPCADCAGIRADLLIYEGRYDLRETYIGTRNGDRTAEKSGRVKLVRGSAEDKQATMYQLEADRADAQRYFLRAGNNELRLLDREKRELATSAPHSLYRAITLAEADSGKAIDIAPGERIVVRLGANPTTGYRWSLLTSGSNSLSSLAAAEYTQAAGADGKTGAGGTESWYFQANRSGQQELRFEYRRPWEQYVPAAKSANYTIRVR